MDRIKQAIRWPFARAERALDAIFGSRNNPLHCLGSLGWYFFWIAAGTGIYLYIFFDTGVRDAYASLERITHDQWYLGGVMRSLHRYASDALVVVVVLHLLREFALDRLRGRRFFAWVTGVPALWFIYICGISGYWLVWDELAQYIAIATAEWLDSLPFFAEPIANNFLDSSTLSGRFFTLMVFIHIFAPLFLLVMMWVHVQRHARAAVNPPRSLAVGTALSLLALSFAFPAVSQAPADLDAVPAELGIDWFYLAAYPLLDVVPGGWLWFAIAAGTLLLVLLPWAPPARPEAPAVVHLDNCNGCARCFDDCPFGAITMEPRSDGAPYEVEAVVKTEQCVSCGVCVGACPTATPFRRASALVPGIELPGQTVASLREQTLEAAAAMDADVRIMVYACGPGGGASLGAAATGGGGTWDARVIEMPCVAMLPPPFVDFVLSRGYADGVMLAGCGEGDCYYRLGGEWTRRRMARTRDPYLRARVPDEQLLQSWLPADAARRRADALTGFAEALRAAGVEAGRGERRRA